MPFDSISGLRASELYQRSDTLKSFSSTQLERFLEIFNAVFRRVRRQGGDVSQAESTAVAIALSSAKRATATAGRSLQNRLVFFAAFAPEILGDGERAGLTGRSLNLNWIVNHPDIANLVVAGNEFNFEHKGSEAALGQIRALVLRDNLPETIASRVDPDIPFVFAASFYEDVNADIEAIEQISPEYIALPMPDGSEVPIPQSFAVAREPLNGPETGIKRVAAMDFESVDAVNAFLEDRVATPSKEGKTILSEPASANVRDGMTPETVQTDPPEGDGDPQTPTGAGDEVHAGFEDLTEKFDALETENAALKEQVEDLSKFKSTMASLFDTGDGDAEPDVGELVETVASLTKERESDKERIAALEDRIVEDQTEQFVAGLVEDGKIKADDEVRETWASMYKNDRETALKAGESLEASFLGENEGKADVTPESAFDDDAEDIVAAADPKRFGKTSKTEGDA